MEAIKNIFFVIIFIGICGCGKQTLDPSDYVSWVNDEENGLVKKKTIHPLEIEVIYKPLPYVIANEKKTNNIPQLIYDARVAELEGMQYYTLKLGIVGGQHNITNFEIEDEIQQQDRNAYLSFAMQKDIKLVEGGDTLPCRLFHFERSYDLVPQRTFVLAFEQKKENITKDKTIILDLPFFKTGLIKLNYKTSDLESIPNLKLQA